MAEFESYPDKSSVGSSAIAVGRAALNSIDHEGPLCGKMIASCHCRFVPISDVRLPVLFLNIWHYVCRHYYKSGAATRLITEVRLTRDL